MKKVIMAGIVVLILCLGIGCSKKQTDKQAMRIGYFPNITHSLAIVMKGQNSLEDKLGDNCKVSWYTFNAGPAEVEAMFAGQIDIGFIGPVPAINANVKSGGDVKIISNACDGGAVLVAAGNSGVQSVEDLAGKTVSVPQLSNTQHLCLLNLLAEHNMDAKSSGGTVEIVAVANADAQGMLKRGQIDAVLLPEPWGSIMEANCDAKIILDYDEIFESGAYPSTVIIVNRKYYEEHMDLVQEFLKVNRETTEYIGTHKEEAIELINTQLEKLTGKRIETDIINRSFARMNFTDQVISEAINQFAKTAKEQGFIRHMPTYEELVDTALVDAAE